MGFLKSLFDGSEKPPSPLDRDKALLHLAKYWDSLGTDAANTISQSFAALGLECLPLLQEIALDTALPHGVRKSALVVGSKFGEEAFAAFMAQHFINGKSPAALYAASQNDGAQANDLGMYIQAKELLEGMGYQIRSVPRGADWKQRDPSRFYIELILESGERIAPKMAVDSDYLSLRAGEEVSFPPPLERALVYITLEAASLRGHVPSGQTLAEVNLVQNGKAIRGCSYEELFTKMRLLKDYGIYGVRGDEDVSRAIQLAWPQ